LNEHSLENLLTRRDEFEHDRECSLPTCFQHRKAHLLHLQGKRV
jgi:hypothetical protein